MKKRKKFWIAFLVFFLAFVFRLVLTPIGFHIDLLSNAYWGNWIYEKGTLGFYDNTVWVYAWPTQPPLANLLFAFSIYSYVQLLEFFRWFSSYVVPHLAPGHMLWWFDFVIWFDKAHYPESYIKVGYFIALKLMAILADIGIAGVLFWLGKKANYYRGVVIAAIYLFSPFSWYLSAIWGQYDQIGFFLLLLAILFCVKRYFVLAPALLVLSISLKPTSLIFGPLFIFIYLRYKPKLIEVVLAFILCVYILFTTARVFTDKEIFHFYTHDLVTKVIYKSGFRVSTNAFNFWHILIGNKAYSAETLFLLVPANYWGYLMFLIVNVLAFKKVAKKSWEGIFGGLTIVGLGGWLFLTNILDRYFFAGIVFLLFLTIYNPRLLKYWGIISLIFWLNLYHGFWFPESFERLRLLLIWNDNLATRILALINVVVFIRIILLIKDWELSYFKKMFKKFKT